MRFIATERELFDVQPEVGDLFTLVQEVNNRTGDRWYRLGFSADGVGGNLNPDVREYHGWRGTTNDIARYACGLRRIEKIQMCKNGNAWITVSKDLKPDEP